MLLMLGLYIERSNVFTVLIRDVELNIDAPCCHIADAPQLTQRTFRIRHKRQILEFDMGSQLVPDSLGNPDEFSGKFGIQLISKKILAESITQNVRISDGESLWPVFCLSNDFSLEASRISFPRGAPCRPT